MLVSLVFFTVAGPAFAAPAFVPLQVGTHYEYVRADESGAVWMVPADVDATMNAKANEYFHWENRNYDNDGAVREAFWRSTEDALYQYNPAGADFLIFQRR